MDDLKKKRQRRIGAYAAIVLAVAAGTFILAYRPRAGLEIRNVDVGQGDCSLIWGDDIPCIMIDGGSSDVKRVAKYRIVPVLLANGIGRIDHCFLTHMDSDHVNGVIEMLEDEMCPVRIANVVISYAGAGYDDSPNLERLVSAAKKKGTRITTISRGDIMSLGDLDITCLAPDDSPSLPFDANAASLVLLLSYDAETAVIPSLFTGDIGFATESRLGADIPKASYLKVAHHGSATSTSDGFLSHVRPDICVISVGEGNSYGHPSPETLDRLNGSGGRIYRTDKCGEVITVFRGGRAFVRHISP